MLSDTIAAIATAPGRGALALVRVSGRDALEVAGRVLELAARPKERAKAVALDDPDVEDVLAFGDRLHLRVRDAAGPLDRLPGSLEAAGVEVARLRSIAPSIEDVFISLLAELGQPPPVEAH